MYTPWGPSQQIEYYNNDVIQVSTASHGGIGVGMDFAEKRLSLHARRYCRMVGYGYYWYEEDCQWAIPAWELLEIRNEIFKWSDEWRDNPLRQEEEIRKCLIFWEPGYAHEENLMHEGDSFCCHNWSLNHNGIFTHADGGKCAVCGTGVKK